MVLLEWRWRENKMKRTKFIIHDHDAFRAGKHQDLRIQVASNKWLSFAISKGVPLNPGVRVLAIKTHDHSSKEALFTGSIPKGEYGGGTLKVFDQGSCILKKQSPAQISMVLQGRKVKGEYHLINIGVTKSGSSKFKQQQYMLFVSKKKSNVIESYLKTLQEFKINNNPDSKYDSNQLKMGIEIEKEHTEDEVIAKSVTKDHLDEIPDYYTRLKKMEKDAGI